MSVIEKEIYQFGPFSLDPVERLISRDGTPLALTPKVFDTLVCLVRNHGRLLTKDELLKEVWPDTFVEEVNLAVNISTLRKALGEGPQDGRYIVTVPGRGYRFVAEVQKVLNGNGNSQSPIGGDGSAVTLELDSRPPERGFIEPLDRTSNGRGQSGMTATWAPKRHPWKLNASVLAALLLAAAIGSYFWLTQRAKNAAASGSSIAVLPFADLSPHKDQEYFSDGLAEELINYLAKVPSVRVVARSSAFQFKGKNEDLRVVGRKLGVTNILEGSVQRDGDRIRIMAELIKAEDGFQLWSQTYERQIGDIFSVQDEIARAVTGTLQVKLLDGNGGTLFAPSRTNPNSYQAYLQSQYFFGRGDDKSDLEKALAYADEAIAFDSKYAPGWVARADTYNQMAGFGFIDNAEGMRKAREDAKRAILLDPHLPSAYVALGDIELSYDWDWSGAETTLNRALELEAGSADVLRYKSLLCESLGRLHEAIELQRQAATLDPLRARSYSTLGAQLYEAGQYTEAQAEIQRALELNPQKEHDHAMWGEILLAQSRPQQALAEMAQDPSAFWRLHGEALAYYPLGRRQDSEAALQRIIATNGDGGAYQIAEVYAYRGESDKAFEWLNRAYRQRDGGLMFVKIDPLLKGLRQDARYIELLKRMHLPT